MFFISYFWILFNFKYSFNIFIYFYFLITSLVYLFSILISLYVYLSIWMLINHFSFYFACKTSVLQADWYCIGVYVVEGRKERKSKWVSNNNNIKKKPKQAVAASEWHVEPAPISVDERCLRWWRCSSVSEFLRPGLRRQQGSQDGLCRTTSPRTQQPWPPWKRSSRALQGTSNPLSPFFPLSSFHLSLESQVR